MVDLICHMDFLDAFNEYDGKLSERLRQFVDIMANCQRMLEGTVRCSRNMLEGQLMASVSAASSSSRKRAAVASDTLPSKKVPRPSTSK